MRTITTTVTVYSFDELSADAQEKAVANIQEKLSGASWDSHDIEDISATMLYALAAAVRSPGWDTYGEGDFPGIDGVRLEGWDLEGGQSINVAGTLTRENAPALPWCAGIGSVNLEAKRDHTYITVEDTEPDCTCTDDVWLSEHDAGCPFTAPNPATAEQRDTLIEAVRDALRTAWQAGRDELEYKTGEEYARQQADDMEFTEDGRFYGVQI